MVRWRLGREVGYIEREIMRSCVENMVMIRFAWWGTFFARIIALKTKATTKHVQTLVKPITTAWIEFFSTIHRFAESLLLSRFFLSKAISRGGRKWVNCCGTCTPFHEGESGHVSWNLKHKSNITLLNQHMYRYVPMSPISWSVPEHHLCVFA
jgi:hypothetical protein